MASRSSSLNTIVYWFRNDLRVHDNPGLLSAFELLKAKKATHVLRPIFFIDPELNQSFKIGVNRQRFLLQSLEQLSENLKELGAR